MATKAKRTTPAQWVLLAFVVAIVSAGFYFASQDERTDWGPILLAAMVPVGMVVRAIFKPPNDEEDDGYGR